MPGKILSYLSRLNSNINLPPRVFPDLLILELNILGLGTHCQYKDSHNYARPRRITELLQCARHCSRCLGYTREQKALIPAFRELTSRRERGWGRAAGWWVKGRKEIKRLINMSNCKMQIPCLTLLGPNLLLSPFWERAGEKRRLA